MGIEVDIKNEPAAAPAAEPATDTPEPVARPEPRTLSVFEEQQQALGWKPEWEWEGDPSEHRSAREFRDRGELLGKLKEANTEIKKIDTIARTLSAQNQQVYKAGYVRALADLKAAKAAAIDKGDGRTATLIDDQIDNVKGAIVAIDAAGYQQQTQTQTKETPAFTEFRESNPWYGKNEDITDYVHGVAMAYVNKNPGVTEEQVYRYMEKKAKETFPTKVGAQQRVAPSPDGDGTRAVGGNTKASGGTSFEKLMTRLPEDQQRTARDMVKRGYLTKEKYVEDYLKLEG